MYQLRTSNGVESMKVRQSSRAKWQALTSRVVPWPIPETAMKQTDVNLNRFIPYVIVTLMVAALTAVLWEVGYIFTLVNIALLYLLPVLLSAVRWGIWPSFYAAGLGVIAFDFFFVPPILTFTVGDVRYFISFGVFLAVATLTASLASQLRQRAKEAKEREAVTSTLYALSRQLAAARDLETVLDDIVTHAAITFELPTAIVLPDANGELVVRAQHGFDTTDIARIAKPDILRWVYEHGKMAGYGPNVHKDASLLYVPLKTETKIHGVMCIGANKHRGMALTENRFRIIEALASLAAVSIARIHFEEEAKLAHLTAESERLRTALLDSISHELRTPLATIIGAVTGMMESVDILTVEAQRELLSTIHEGALRMNRLVTNLLGMVRLESGMLRLNKQWCDVADIVGVALGQVQAALQSRTISVTMQNGLPAIHVDDVLIQQVLVNLLSNAIKYSPDGSEIQINVMEYDGILTIRVRDHGIGIQPEEEEKIFEKFYRSDATKDIPGTGLGLAICKGVIHAHGGEIFARRAEDVGTIVTIRIPVGETDELSDEEPCDLKEKVQYGSKNIDCGR